MSQPMTSWPARAIWVARGRPILPSATTTAFNESPPRGVRPRDLRRRLGIRPLEERRVEPLDVPHAGVDASRSAHVDEGASLGRRGGQRLFDEDVDALGGEGAHG